MSIQHIVRCDALLPNGHRCETRAEMKSAYDLPKGWTSIVQYERPTAEQGGMFGSFSPMMSSVFQSIKDDPTAEDTDKAEKMVASMNAAALEHAPNVPHHGHVCDKHELPKLELAAHSIGCLPVGH